jgi:mannosyltransferase OCH1-like enzyme
LTEIIQTFSLTQNTIPLKTVKSDQIPKVIHLHWGGHDLPEHRYDNLKKLREYNPEHKIILWIHPAINMSRTTEKMQEYSIDVIDLRNIYNESMPL